MILTHQIAGSEHGHDLHDILERSHKVTLVFLSLKLYRLRKTSGANSRNFRYQNLASGHQQSLRMMYINKG